jgi:hypothetical protein
VAEGLHALRNQITLEIIPGELYESLERLRFESRCQRYNRIYQSNIPVSFRLYCDDWVRSLRKLRSGLHRLAFNHLYKRGSHIETGVDCRRKLFT